MRTLVHTLVMDPNACLENLINAQINSSPEYSQHLADLIDWLQSGGFGPTVQLMQSGAQGKLISLSYTGDAKVRWLNNRTSTVRLQDLGTV